MTQITFHKEHIQSEMIRLLQLPTVHAMVFFGWARSDSGQTIDPLLMVADDMPSQDAFIKEFYALCDRYLHFQEMKDLYEQQHEEGGTA